MRVSQVLVVAFSACAALSFASCERKPPPPTASAPAAAPDPAALPPVDAGRLKARMAPEQTLEVVDFARDGETTIAGKLQGWRAPVYAVPVAAGQTLKVELKGAGVFVNVGDAADPAGTPLHTGETDGPKTALKADRPTVYFVAPYQPPEASRAAKTTAFTLMIGRASK